LIQSHRLDGGFFFGGFLPITNGFVTMCHKE
jgi:hypothetical protein